MHFSNLVGKSKSDTDALLRAAFQQTRMAMIATDPRQDDNPIVLVNPAFEKLTGYEEKEAVGRNCRFLQGEQTDPGKVGAISEALRDERWGFFELRNYRKDGTPFWNALHVSPVYDDDGELIFFFGSQWDVSDRVEAEQRLHLVTEELAHRIRNMFTLVLSIVNTTGADEDTEAFREEVRGRLRALVDAHESVFARAGERDARAKAAGDDTVGGARSGGTQTGGWTGDGSSAAGISVTEAHAEVGDVARRVLAPYDVTLEGPAVPIEGRAALDLALVLHELATNSVKYGSLSAAHGRTHLAWRPTRPSGEIGMGDEGARATVHLDWTERGGPPTKRPHRPGFGSQLLTMIAAGCGRESAGLDYAEKGLTYRFALPVAT